MRFVGVNDTAGGENGKAQEDWAVTYKLSVSRGSAPAFYNVPKKKTIGRYDRINLLFLVWHTITK